MDQRVVAAIENDYHSSWFNLVVRETRWSGYGVAPFVVPGVTTGCGAVFAPVSVAGAPLAGAGVVAGAVVVGVVVAGIVVAGATGLVVVVVAAAASDPVPVENPLFPLRPSPPAGSTPSGDPPFKPSTPFKRGRSSELTGFTRSAVMMNINSVSCFWNEDDLNKLPRIGISPSTGIFDIERDSLLSSRPANAKLCPSRSSTPVRARRVRSAGITKPLNRTPFAKSMVETSGSSSRRM